LSWFVFGLDFFFAVERVRFTGFIKPSDSTQLRMKPNCRCFKRKDNCAKREQGRFPVAPDPLWSAAKPLCLETTLFSSTSRIRGLLLHRYRAVTRELCERW
jgi:hypothetical protein